jgi:hypothetical protein
MFRKGMSRMKMEHFIKWKRSKNKSVQLIGRNVFHVKLEEEARKEGCLIRWRSVKRRMIIIRSLNMEVSITRYISEMVQ